MACGWVASSASQAAASTSAGASATRNSYGVEEGKAAGVFQEAAIVPQRKDPRRPAAVADARTAAPGPTMQRMSSHRLPVPLDRATRLVNHGPTVLVSATHGGRSNVMAAAWNMALDFAPPKVAVVIDKITFTRGLIESSGHFTLSVPCHAQAALTSAIGGSTGKEIDKAATLPGLAWIDEPASPAPLVDGCVAWLTCRLLPEPHIQQTYDLFLGEVIGAWADERVFSHGRWHFEGHDGLRTLHHVAGGHYLVPGGFVGTPP